MSLDVKIYGNEVLKKQATPIVDIDDEIKALVDDMFQACYDTNGVGLAAPQVGKSIRLFILSIPPEDDEELEDRDKYFEEALINPQITKKKGKMKGEEGCLSIPNVYETVERSKFVSVEYTDINGEKKQIENATGLLARAIQHENDHLDGILFVDRLSPLKQQFVKKKLNKKYNTDWK